MVVVSLDVAPLTETELRPEILLFGRRVRKRAARLRLVLAVQRVGGFSVAHQRLPDGRAKQRILTAVDQARTRFPLRALLRILRLSPSRFHAWRRRDTCTRRTVILSAYIATSTDTSRFQLIEEMVTSPEYGHVPTGRLAVLAQRLRRVWAAPSTWSRLVRRFGWRRPRLRVQPAKPKIGMRATRPTEVWHIDPTVIRLLDGTRAYLHAVNNHFSRRILAWRVVDTFAPVNAQIDELLTTGVLRRSLAFTELRVSNSMLDAWWRSLKHQCLLLHPLNTVATVGRRVAFYVDQHDRVLPTRPFADRRRTRCTSVRETRCPPT